MPVMRRLLYLGCMKPGWARTAVRIALSCFWACLASTGARSQSGNQWVDYSRQYWKVPVWQDGLHRISYEALQSAGFPLSGSPAESIQLWHREKQLRITVEDGGDGQLNPGDFIEFWGRRNDGWLDSLTYDHPAHTGNPFYSLFNDTSWVFITTAEQPGNRIILASNPDNDLHPVEDYCWFTIIREYHDEYHQGQVDANGIALPSYGEAEGWMSFRFSKGTSFHTDLSTPNGYSGTGAPDARVETTCAGASLASGFPNHHLQVGWGSPFNLISDTVYSGYGAHHFDFVIPASSVGSSTRITHRSVDDLGVPVDNHRVAWVRLTYAHSWDFSDYAEGTPVKLVDQNGDGWIHARIQNLSITSPRFILGEAGLWTTELEATEEADGWHLSLPVSWPGAGTLLRIISQQTFTAAAPVTRATTSGFFTDFATLQPDSAMVIITHRSLWQAANAYAVYRQQQGMEVLVADVDELYMQFGGGIPKHPLAVSRFCLHLTASWSSLPSHLFILGKGIHEMTIAAQTGARSDPDHYARNLVPTWGWPCSDAMFTARWSSPLYAPKIPTGRLAAETPAQVQEYLAKVIQLESQPPARWQKNILHFGGGGNAFEQNLFKGYLQGYELTAEDTSYAARVFTFLKNTTDPIQMNLSDSIRQLIDDGVAVMTFFGHASSTGFDQNLDEPENYNNEGKYPLLIGNSCYTGNIHLSESQSTSERFVLAPQRGVIGFIAKGDPGIPLYLDLFTSALYRNLFQDRYGWSVGQCIRQSITDFQQAGDFYLENTALTFALHGDPSVRLYTHPEPDYDVQVQDLRFHPAQVTAQADTLEVHLQVHNMGKAVNHPVAIELIRRFPDGTDTSLVQTVDAILHHRDVVFSMPIDPARAAGLNFFDVLVDYPASAVEELEEVANNVLNGIPLTVTTGDLVPVQPYPFAIVPQPDLVLLASTGSALEPERTYLMQLDTTDTFDSPWMSSATFTQSGGVIGWELPFALTDSTVYFWRCSADSTGTGQPYRWRVSSFQYISGVSGWAQDHFFQLENNPRSGLGYHRDTRSWSFDPLEATLRCEVFGNPSTPFEALGTRFMIDLDVQDYSGPGFYPCLMAAVMDSISLLPWQSNFNGANPGNEFGNSMVSANARGRPEKYFVFEQDDAAQLQGLANMLTNEVEDGQYVLVYSWMYATYDTWNVLAPSLIEAFGNLGAQVIGQSQDSVPFIFFAQKGSPGSVVEVVGADSGADISLEAVMAGRSDLGVLESPPIGPALNWSRSSWRFAGGSEQDSLVLSLDGIAPQGNAVDNTSSTLWSGEEGNLGALLDEGLFPQARLRATLSDGQDATPLQHARWHVEYEPVPEAALDPASGYSFPQGQIPEGQQVAVSMAIRNISPISMDSLLVRYWIEDASRMIHPIAYPRQAPLASGAILLDTVSFSTTGLRGSNVLFIEVNPLSPTSGTWDQPEQFHFNNIAQIPFTVEGDRTNPLLDVTFDGQHILNRDIVSATPEIAILLDDDNPYLLLNEPGDTALYRLFITEPGSDTRPVYFSDEAVTWLPAEGGSNRSGIIYRPAFTRDGIHRLLVQARDKSGNLSGGADYRIEFEVILRPTISEVLNYPNPFSTSTRFVFTLTGPEVPDEWKIQVMTIGGRVVREVNQEEIGPLRIGRNITEFAWNGTDEFGDPLANGVYLYRVVARLRGQDLELRQDSGRSFTEKGFGKMYLLR